MTINHSHRRFRAKKPRVVLTQRELDRLFETAGTRSAAVLAKRTGISYMLVYNLVNRRVRSVSHRHYTLLFGTPPPNQDTLKVDGAAFRAMAELWLFLHDGLTRADLYRQLTNATTDQKVDHRIFSGKVKSIDAQLAHRMRRLFADAGVDDQLLTQWLDEFEAMDADDMVPYQRIRPSLRYLKEKVGLHPTAVLNQSVVRYERGALKRVSRRIADHVLALRRRTENVLNAPVPPDADKIRDTLIGGRSGYTLFSEVRDDLQFLRRYAGKSVKRYLGRGLWTYASGNAKRIADWRARAIATDCHRFIQTTPNLPLAALPPVRRMALIRNLTAVLAARTAQLLDRAEGMELEKRILKPTYPRDEYTRPYHGFTPFDMAWRALGMQRRAFDLMVAKNCDIFRAVGKFSQRWYLSDLYLKELSARKHFGMISAKYEHMAKTLRRSESLKACMN